jgi:hypothetical protein
MVVTMPIFVEVHCCQQVTWAKIKNLHRHPFEFYQKAGFSIVGVVPDANGPGKPDILMAKRLYLPVEA